MSTIFTLKAQNIPQLEQIQQPLQGQYAFEHLNQPEALKAFSHCYGVVLLSLEPNLASSIAAVRVHAPRLSIVCVIPPDGLASLDPSIVSQCDVLCIPVHPMELQARIHTACQLSELRYLIESAAQLDEMTGLYTQGYFLKRLGEEMSLATRHLSPVSCVIIEFPAYAFYLDTYGFDAATRILKGLAQLCQEQIRNEDLIARVGDNEVALLLPRSTEKGAATLAQRIVQRTKMQPFKLGEDTDYLEIKAGIASYPFLNADDPGDADTLVRFTRHALHHARCNEDIDVQLFSQLKPVLGS